MVVSIRSSTHARRDSPRSSCHTRRPSRGLSCRRTGTLCHQTGHLRSGPAACACVYVLWTHPASVLARTEPKQKARGRQPAITCRRDSCKRVSYLAKRVAGLREESRVRADGSKIKDVARAGAWVRFGVERGVGTGTPPGRCGVWRVGRCSEEDPEERLAKVDFAPSHTHTPYPPHPPKDHSSYVLHTTAPLAVYHHA